MPAGVMGVVTRALLGAEWPTLERSIAVWSDPAGTRGRVIPLLRENVSLLASLRIRNWIDFRDEGRFEESFAELVRVLRGDKNSARKRQPASDCTGDESAL